MMFNPTLMQLLAEEHKRRHERMVEQVQLIRSAEGLKKSGGWRLPVTLVLKSLLALLVRLWS